VAEAGTDQEGQGYAIGILGPYLPPVAQALQALDILSPEALE
jgi:hypothetical protein